MESSYEINQGIEIKEISYALVVITRLSIGTY
jgi:hypothetical protein